MMKESETNTAQVRKGFVLAENAMSVYRFMANLPSPIAEFVFRTIIEDARMVASVINPEIAKEQFIDAVCNNLYAEATEEDVIPLLDCIGISDYNDKFDDLVDDREGLRSFVRDNSTLSCPPDFDRIMSARGCFVPQGIKGEFETTILSSIQNKMLNIVQDNPGIEDDLKGVFEISCFEYLGYLTKLHAWYSQPDSGKEDNILFFRWYGKGEILDVVLETVFKCGVSSISRSLWNLIQNACHSDSYLTDLFNERYNELSRYYRWTDRDPFEFTGIRKAVPTDEDMAMSLPKIYKKGGQEVYSNEEVQEIYMYLVDNGCIDSSMTDAQTFRLAFDGKGRLVKKIIWQKGQQELAALLYIFQGSKATNKSYAEKAAKLFLQKNGKACKPNTLNQPNLDLAKEIYNAICNRLSLN